MMLKTERLLLFFLGIVFSHNLSYGKHIIGGDLTFKCVGIDSSNTEKWIVSYEFTMNMYRDCFQGGGSLTAFDQQVDIGVYRNSLDTWIHVRTVYADFSNRVTNITNIEDPCIGRNSCYDKGIYYFTIDLEMSSDAYLISYQRCCRNRGVTNIINSGDTGEVLYTYISPESQRTCNSSPIFKNTPLIEHCLGTEYVFDNGVIDNESDTLVYRFCPLLQAGGDNENNPNACDGTTPNSRLCPPPFEVVEFISPTYSHINPVLGNPGLSVDPFSGIISGNPALLGNFLIGVCIEEYRKGVLISRIMRNFQIDVLLCSDSLSLFNQQGMQCDDGDPSTINDVINADCECLGEKIVKEITLTNLITPDGDGQNDFLRFSPEGILEESEIWIYNRWGDQIYHKKNYTNDWNADGFSGGTYFYVLDISGVITKKTLTVLK